METRLRDRCRRRGVAFLLALAAAALVAAAPAEAAPDDPLAAFVPNPFLPKAPPPTGYLNGPCGLAVDASGFVYVSDHYHDAVDLFSSGLGFEAQLSEAGRPCGLALDATGRLYVNAYHGPVTRYGPRPGFGDPTLIDAGPATGVAVSPVSGQVYVNRRTHVAVYDSSGAPVEAEGEPLRIGLGTLGDGYGLAVSGFADTAGYVYVPDASEGTVKVYEPATDAGDPVQVIDAPGGGFASLRDSEVAVDDASGRVYVVDNLDPADTEEPRGLVRVFDAGGAYLGHLKHYVVHGGPSGLAVDNTGGTGQGRVYVTSGNSDRGGFYVYPPGAATTAGPLPSAIPPEPGAPPLILTRPSPVGGPAAAGSGIACEGDDCQILPPEPVDPTLTTLLRGLGNPRVRYRRLPRRCGPLAREARRLARQARRLSRQARRAARRGGRAERMRRGRRLAARSTRLRRRTRRADLAARRCRRANRRGQRARASSSAARDGAAASRAAERSARAGLAAPGAAAPAGSTAPSAAGLAPGAAGFDAAVSADGGGPATLAGSHPYALRLFVGLDQGGGAADLREVELELPVGLLANPAAVTRCSAVELATPRSSPFEASRSGESCPDRSQVGTIEVRSGAGGGATRRFGLFRLDAAPGAAFRLGASPFGEPLVFEAEIRFDGGGAYEVLRADVPQGLEARSVELALWGVPWNSSHDTERGGCLNESEPAFPWAKCSVGEPFGLPPAAFLTLPTRCGEPPAFSVRARSWQQPDALASRQAVNRDSDGEPAPVAGCETLAFDPHAEGLLSVEKASSSAGFAFRFSNVRFTNDYPGLVEPRARINSYPRRAVVELPQGTTLNPSLGAGLGVCTPAQLAAESAFNPPGAGCPNAAKIGDFSVRTPFYEGHLRGGIYVAQPDDPRTAAAGAENPFDSLLAVYLIAKSADRGLLVRIPGELRPDPGDGTITATFDRLPQFPYTDLEVSFRTGQRAPLVSPPRCGPAATRIELAPWAQGAPPYEATSDTQITSGIDFGPCPDGSTPPFAPGAVAGGVNANVGYYTPYYVHLTRADTEQEITSYSLELPKGITGRLAGIPFCPEEAIAAARARRGFEEIADPSCPAASQVGRTLSGYGVGSALTYSPGRIYLAGPYNGRPLSLVTINAATVGPFDLGTIVIRSAFAVDPRTAQLRIDAGASDPIPHILGGVPLHLRSVRVYMDRPQFTRNPTGCEAAELVSTLTGSGARFDDPSDDSTATARKHFQLLNCLELGFRPHLGLRLFGGVRRGSYPALRAVFRARPGDASVERIAVTMPHSLFLAQNHIRAVCTRPQFEAERCPPGSVYGRAVVRSDLFGEPLRGPVYLRSSEGQLPDLVASLRSGEVRIVLKGKIGPSEAGGIRAFFERIPDAPIQRFVLWLAGGRRGLLVNAANICASPPQATVKALAHNNRGAIFSTELRGQCKRGRGKPGSRRPPHRRRSGGRQ